MEGRANCCAGFVRLCCSFFGSCRLIIRLLSTAWVIILSSSRWCLTKRSVEASTVDTAVKHGGHSEKFPASLSLFLSRGAQGKVSRSGGPTVTVVFFHWRHCLSLFCGYRTIRNVSIFSYTVSPFTAHKRDVTSSCPPLSSRFVQILDNYYRK